MKILTILIAMLMAIGGCSKVPEVQLVERGGLNYEVNSQTPFTGSAVEYDENGQLYSKINYKDGKKDGLSEFYMENGQLVVKSNYKDGELDGLLEWYFWDGSIVDKKNYKDGKEIPLN